MVVDWPTTEKISAMKSTIKINYIPTFYSFQVSHKKFISFIFIELFVQNLNGKIYYTNLNTSHSKISQFRFLSLNLQNILYIHIFVSNSKQTSKQNVSLIRLATFRKYALSMAINEL